MADIAMCRNQTCTIRKTCYRHEAKPSLRQTMAIFKEKKPGKCDHYWPFKSKSELRRLNVVNKG